MSLFRTMIIAGQMGRIWATTSVGKKIYSSMAVVGYFGVTSNNESPIYRQVFTIGDMSTGQQTILLKHDLMSNFKLKAL